MPIFSSSLTSFSSISTPALTSTSPRRGHDHVFGDHAAEHALAQALDHIAAFDDRRDRQPLTVPQSISVTTRSCATSTKRRVRYPEFAVFNAVSAKPLRAP